MAKIYRFSQYSKELSEDHMQTNIPFEEPEYAGKSVHEELRDALNDLKVMDYKNYYTKSSSPRSEFDKIYDKALDRILKGELENDTITYLYNFISQYSPADEDNADLFKQSFIESIEDDIENTDDVVEAAKDMEPKDVFSEKGLTLFKELASDKFYEDTSDCRNTIEDSFDKDTEGLISIWRTVDYKKDDDAADLYDTITKKYGGVGVYWTWNEDSAEAYWGTNSGHSVTLHGKVSVENVDWEITLYKNGYGLMEEKEIKVKDGGAVMLVGFHDDRLDKYYEFDEPIVVKSSK